MDNIFWLLLIMILVFQKAGCGFVANPMTWNNAVEHCSNIGEKLKCVSSETDIEEFGDDLYSRKISEVWVLNTTKFTFGTLNSIGCSNTWTDKIATNKDYGTRNRTEIFNLCQYYCSSYKYFTIHQNVQCYCFSSRPYVFCNEPCKCDASDEDVRVLKTVKNIVECSKIRFNESETCLIQTSSCNDILPFICKTMDTTANGRTNIEDITSSAVHQKCNAKVDPVTESESTSNERVSACVPLHKYSTTKTFFSSEAFSTSNDTFSTATAVLSSPHANFEGTIAAVVAVIVVVVIIGVITVVCVVLRKRKNMPKSKADLSTHNVQNQSYDKQGVFDTTNYAAIAEPVLYSEPIINGTKGQGEQMNSVNNEDYRQTSDKTGNDEGEYIENFQNNYDHLGAKSERKRLPDGPNHMYAHAQIGTSYSEYDTTRSVTQDIELGVYDNPKSYQ